MSPINTLKKGLTRLQDQICALDALEATGILQHSNCMDVAQLLSPDVEAHNIFEATDKDIFQSVVDAKVTWEQNVRVGDDCECAACIEPGPTRKEALQAALILWNFIKELDNPFAHNLELMLCSFGPRTSH
jgi:hypothetical protein